MYQVLQLYKVYILQFINNLFNSKSYAKLKGIRDYTCLYQYRIHRQCIHNYIQFIKVSNNSPMSVNQSVSGNQLAAPFIIHIVLTIIQMILLTFSLLYCLPKLIQLNIFLAALNNLYTVIIFMISFFIEYNNQSYDFLGDRLVIQILCFLMFEASIFFFCVIKSATQRLLILVKQAGQLEFIDGCCI
ncbi:hypothetical protein ABPG72_000640 [Tetrahymena utriculariae]